MIQTCELSVIFDFSQPNVAPWSSIDDVVMGGVSHSTMRAENGRAVFEGVVSLDHGGGFASVRSAPGLFDLSACEGIEATIRGDGRRYKLRLKVDPGFDGLNWEAPFETRTGERQIIRISLKDAVPVYRGHRVADAAPLDRHRITTFGFLISDRQAGPFRLEIGRIAAYR